MKNCIKTIWWHDDCAQVIIRGPNFDMRYAEDYIVIGEGKDEKEALTKAAINLKIMAELVEEKLR